MIVLDEYQTIEKIRETRASISRYGDGEFKICMGGSAKFQKGGSIIAERMRKILKSNMANHIVGIPRIFEKQEDWCNGKKEHHWQKYATKSYQLMLDSNKVYGSAFITRPDSATKIDNPEYFRLVKQLWKDRFVLLVRGFSAGFEKDRTIFETASSWHVICGPDRDAFDNGYVELVKEIVASTTPEDVVVLSLGPTATIMAYDLHIYGRQALDLGHLGMFYAKIHPKGSDYNGSNS